MLGYITLNNFFVPIDKKGSAFQAFLKKLCIQPLDIFRILKADDFIDRSRNKTFSEKYSAKRKNRIGTSEIP
tara:strand:- start:117 stop:332 length:216 start_codon:yes stop_codon:yes gene_type:complete